MSGNWLAEINREIRGPAFNQCPDWKGFPEARIDYVATEDTVVVLLRPVLRDTTSGGPSIFDKANQYGYLAESWWKLARHAATMAASMQIAASKLEAR